MTGGLASGKTELLTRLESSLRPRWTTCGFLSPAAPRARGSGRPSAAYRLSVVGRPGTLPWAERRADGPGFEFHEETRAEVAGAVRADLDRGEAEVCLLDEIGRLEVEGAGFADLFRRVLRSRCRVVVAAVRKDRLEEVRSAFGLETADAIDLDETDAARALRLARRRVSASDAERIGMFGGISGLVEVGLGSTLHAYRVPFKGHALAYVQNLLLITFGKALHGRGLLRLSFLGAMLKAFSPMGARFRPMLYIFVQGACFAAPVRALGWNLAAVLIGSVLMGWFTLGLSLAVDYVVFGASIFDAYSGAIASISRWIGVGAPTLLSVIAAAFVLKGLLSLALATGAWFGNTGGLVRRLSRRAADRRKGDEARARAAAAPRSTAGHALAALRDLARPRFAIGFLVSMLLLLFFANLSTAGFASVLVRGLCISWLGLLAVRRIDLLAVGGWLDRRLGLNLGRSLPVALGVLGRPQPVEPDARPEAESAPPPPSDDNLPSG